MVQNSENKIISSDKENLYRAGKKTKGERSFEAVGNPGQAVRDLILGGD
jgi:hypothetical protein